MKPCKLEYSYFVCRLIMMYCIMGLRTSLCLLILSFLSFHTLNDENFRQRFLYFVQARVVIFGMQVDNDKLYCEIANQPSDAYSSLYLSDFLSIF